MTDPHDMAPGDEVSADAPSAAEDICPRCGGDGVLDEGTDICPECEGAGRVIKAVGGG